MRKSLVTFLAGFLLSTLSLARAEKVHRVVGPNVERVRRGLAAYSSDYHFLGQQDTKLVDKIFRGARPADLPIEQPHKLDLVVNLKTARAIGLKVPKEILLRANELVE